MIERFVGIVHAQACHDRSRALVADRGKGDDLGQREPLEAEVQRAERGFGGETLPPMRVSEAPARTVMPWPIAASGSSTRRAGDSGR